MSVLLGQSDHNFIPARGSPFHTGGSAPSSVVVADLNGDGHLDLVTANAGSDSVSVLHGSFDGSFGLAAGSPFSVGGIRPLGLAVADVNGDTLLDIVTANSASNTVSILLGRPDYRFIAAVDSPLSVGGPHGASEGPVAIAVADLNDDGLMDLVAVDPGHGGATNNVSVLLGQLDHRFRKAPGTPLSEAGGPVSVTAIDLNGDQILDIVTANAFSDSVSVFALQPDHSFVPVLGSPFPTEGLCPVWVAVADINGDAMLDLVTANVSSDNLSILLGQADHAFAPLPGSPLTMGGDHFPTSLAAADLNHDGHPDLATTSSGSDEAQVYLQRADHSFASVPTSAYSVGGTGPSSINVADFNRDGFADLVTANAGSGNVSLLFGQADHNFVSAPGSPFAVGESDPTLRGPYAVAIADIDDDGLLDIATANGNLRNVSVLVGQADSTLLLGPPLWPPSLSRYITPISIAVADLNGDKLLDVATVGPHGGGLRGVTLLLGQPDHTFQVRDLGSSNFASLAIGDIGGDGIVDLIAAAYFSDKVSVFLGTPDPVGSLNPFEIAPFPFDVGGERVEAVAVADLNGDGLLDIITANRNSHNVSVLLGRSDGTLVAAAGSPFRTSTRYPSSIAVVDLNGDGFLDIAAAGYGGIGLLLQIAP